MTIESQAQSKRSNNLKLSAAQITMLRNELAPAGSEGRSFVSNISTGNALITKGMAEQVKGRYSANTIVITPAGCEAIGLDYNDVISAQLKKAAKREMIAYVTEESVVATEAELIAWTGWDADPQYLIDAYIAAGGEMIVEETDAPVIEETSALSPYIACACGQLLAPNEGPMCPTCKGNGGKPRENRQLIMGCDGYPIGILDTAASEDELPAKMPMPAIVDADTMPPMDVVTQPAKTEYAEGQIVRFHYWLSNVDNSVYTGRINGFKSSVTFGETALIEPIKNAYHLTPRYVPMSRIIEVVSNEAEVLEPAFTFTDVQRLEKAWFAAQSEPRNFDEAISEPFYSRTRNAHTAYLIAYAMYHNAPWMMPCAEDIEALRSRQSAPIPPHNGTPAAVDVVEAFSGALDQRKPEIASEPFAPVNATNDHPLALIQPGSEASKTDWDALKVKRDGQYAEAYERVYGAPPAPKKTAREPLPRVRAYRKENAAEIVARTKRIIGQ
jgi:hypothetical protein